MNPQQNKLVIARFAGEVINNKNLDAINELVAEGFVARVPFPGQGPGREGRKHAIGLFLSAFPDIQWTLDEQIAEGEVVVSRFTWTGTHRGKFLGIPPSGKRAKVWGVVMDVVTDGRLSESRIIMDTLGLLQQLGAIPPSREAA
jgi:steroid delta-isomerase-like uncharacterized protein